MQMVFSLDVALHNEAFTELFNWFWDLWSQYGEDNYEFMYFGKNGWEKIRLNREEIQGKYKITVRGNDQNTNPQVKQMKAQQILMAVTNPVLLQTGVITPQQIANGLKRFYQTLDVENWEEFVNAQPQPPQQPPAPAQLIKTKFEDLTDAEKAQVLKSAGVQPDVPGRAIKNKDDLTKP